ncbi:MAG TPA: hypothetical protein VH054_03650, partial [Polyangiaceae bacterium]|nr:hypothetical protein [Polyangiaceae bacterium]
MKLVTFRHSTGHDRAGVIAGEHVIDLARAFASYEHARGRRCDEAHVFDRYGRGVLGFVEHASRARPVADEIVEAYARGAFPETFEGAPIALPLSRVTLRAPIPRPPSMRDGYAFRQHVLTARRNRGLEMIPEFDQFPVFYFTNAAGVVGPGDVQVEAAHLD